MKIYLLCLAFISCLTTSCNNAASETAVAPQKPVLQQNKADFRSKAPSDQLKTKHLPILGDDREQLDFKVRDAQAILDNKPRPTSPITLAVLAGNPPSDVDVCNLPFSALTKLMFEQCAEQGMSYIQVANTFGFAGDLTTESGNSKTYSWRSSGGMVAITFVDDKLTAKTQQGLK